MADGSVKIDITADDSNVKKKLKETEEGLDDVGKKTDETSKKTDEAKSKYEELTTAIREQTKELTSLKGEYTQAVVNFGKNSTEAKELASRIDALNSDLSKNKAEFSAAHNAAKEMTSALDENEKSFGAVDVAAGNLVSNGLTALIGKLSEGVQSLFALAEETREYREDMAKLDTAFTTTGHSSETANKAYKSFYAILGESDRSVEAVNHLAELTKNEQEVAQWSTIAAGVTAKFGDSLPIEGLTEAANETAKVGKVTGPLADALNWAGISEEEFNKQLEKCNSEQERATLITNTLNKEYEAAAAEYNELTASTQAARTATADMEEVQARLGGAIEPLTTAWTNLKVNALEAIAPVIETLVAKFQEVNQWLDENPEKATIIKAAIIAVATALGVLAAALAISGIIQGVTAAFGALGGVMALVTSPVTLIIAGIAALVAAFLYLWNNCEAFRNFWIDMWETIKPYAQNAWEAIKGFFVEAWNRIKTVWDIAKPYFMQLWEGIKSVFSVVGQILGGYFKVAWAAIQAVWNVAKAYFQMVWNNIKAVFSAVKAVLSGDFQGAWDAIKSIWGNVKAFFSTVWENIKSVFSTAKEQFMTIGSNIVAGIKSGISNAWSNLKSWFSGLFGDLKEIAKTILGIHSPSKYFIWIAEMIMQGLVKGIKDNEKLPIAGIKTAGVKMIKAMQENAKAAVKSIEAEIEEKEKLREKGNKAVLDEELKTLKEELKIAQDREKAIEKFSTSFEKQLDEMAKAEQTYADNVKSINEKLANDIEKVHSDYDTAFNNRVKSITDGLKLFEMAEKGKAVSGKSLIDAVKSQNKVLTDYNTALDNLATKNVSTDFIEAMKGMGVDALPQLEAINKMSDEQLTEYVALWEEKTRLAKEAATDEMAVMREEASKKILELNTQADKDLETVRATYQTRLIELAGEMGVIMTETGESGVIALGEQITEYADCGKMLMEGLIDGMESKRSAVIDLFVNNVRAGIQAAKAEAGIHSPSTVMRDEVGGEMGEGFIVGWKNKLTAIKKAMSGGISGITADLRTTVGAENARYGYNAGRTDTGMSDLTRAVGIQTAGINSLASIYSGGTQNKRPVILQLNGRELGRAVVDVGGAETSRIGTKISVGGAY